MKNPPKIYAISDGRAGIERQAQALAGAISQQLGTDFVTHRLNPQLPQSILPPQFWPAPIYALPSEQREIVQNPPDIWIANGRRSIPYSLWIKANHSNCFVVQIQDPKVNSRRFDAVVAPQHDKVQGANVFETLGGLVWYSKKQIAQARIEFRHYCEDERTRILVILGGNSKTHSFTIERAREILGQLLHLQNELGLENIVFWISVSRRTPADIANLFREHAEHFNHHFFESEDLDGKNPYLAWLSCADYALVTEDSANMLSDCAFFGLSIHLLRLSGQSRKFDILHKSFINMGAAIWFDGNLHKLAYNQKNSVDSIAKSIIALWQKS